MIRTVFSAQHPTWRCLRPAPLLALLLAGLPLRAARPDERPAGELANLQRLEAAFQTVIAQVTPSVVGIRVQRRVVTLLDDGSAGGVRPFEQLVTVNGGGAVIDRQGLILTNEHVVQSANEIVVCFHDGQTLPATVVAADARSDLAVLEVARADLQPVRFVDWSRVARGQWVLALGNPYGLGNDGNLSVSVGWISNLGRRLPGLGEVDDRFYADMIQTTASIHPGCSGGPLFNIHGELVGIVTAMHTRAPVDEGIGFAIPMSPQRRETIRRLCAGRPIVYGYLGVSVRAARPEEQQAAGVEPPAGAVVQDVDPAGPAAQAGVRSGDLILRFNGELVADPASLAERVGRTPPGREVTLEIRRGGRPLLTRATVQRRQVSRVSWMRGGALLWRGLRLAELTPQSGQRLGVEATAGGVVVIDVAPNSPGAHAGVRIGDVIEGVFTAEVSNLAAFRELVREQQGVVRVRVRGRGELLVEP